MLAMKTSVRRRWGGQQNSARPKWSSFFSSAAQSQTCPMIHRGRPLLRGQSVVDIWRLWSCWKTCRGGPPWPPLSRTRRFFGRNVGAALRGRPSVEVEIPSASPRGGHGGPPLHVIAKFYAIQKPMNHRASTSLRPLIALTLLPFVPVASHSSQHPAPSTSATSPRDSRYPAHWWTPVPKEGAPDWEILPQEAGPGEVILSKRHELGLLSNFAATPFIFRGKHYASLEGFWQMMLYPEGPGRTSDPRAKYPALEWKYTREQVAEMTSFEAKNAGSLAEENMKKMGINWVTFEGTQIEYRPAEPGEHYR